MDILDKLYTMTAFGDFVESPLTLIMIALALFLLYLGIKKKYEPLLLVPIAFGVLLANFPGGNMAVIQANEQNQIMHLTVLEIAKEYGIMNMLYYMLIKTGLLPLHIGIYGGFDYGRVWFDNFLITPSFTTTYMRTSTGGGVFFNAADMITGNVSAFHSSDGLRLAFSLGFAF